MIRRTVKVQLAAFVIISLVGIFYVGSNYIGLHLFSPGPYTVKLNLAGSGGIFSNAEVTERGVTVGRVGAMKVTPQGVQVDLKIDHGKKIPANVHATVANLSAVGEQYVDLDPQTNLGPGVPVLKDGSVIPQSATTLPLDDATMLLDLDRLVTSVDQKHLATVIDELGKGFNDVGPSLQALIDNGNALTQQAIQTLPDQLRLINDSRTVLDTQNAVAGELKTWASTFASFSDQLRQSDPDLRGVLDNGVTASKQLAGLLRDNESVLPTLLGNLITVNQIQAVRLPYVRATLELFPSLTAGGYYVTPGDGTAHFGMVSDNNSNPCTEGYQSTKLRGNNDNGHTPSDWGGPANLDAYCHGSGITSDYRGSRNVPRPDNAQVTNSDPYPGPRYGHSNHPTVKQQEQGGYSFTGSGGTGAASAQSGANTVVPLPYDPLTGLLTGLDGKQYQLGYSGPLTPIFGSSSWEWLLLAPTMR
ncbi:MAG TPA: MCE family protein [Mycobacteriales bacterium]|nr:MCE family protein [Mycobacteriales bacterium]